MKGRSQRLQRADQPDDWVDDSWIVDCICGVNFDDGEEMVKCDLCGVWEHTRCSRYVKEEEEFACNKCKSKNNKNDSEETEVAQLLVELPTKPVRMESSYAASGPPARRHPLRLWTNKPMEERVHVQGVPGGDPGLFSGLSSVFSQQLWKCSGYVPKKFNFQYREFPCWGSDSNKEIDANTEEENDNSVDKGAGVLFSLSKDSVLASPNAAFVGTIGKDEDSGYDKKPRLKETKKVGVGHVEIRRSINGTKKEKGLSRPIVIHSGKRKQEESAIIKDDTGNKKARVAEKDLDGKKRGDTSSKAVYSPTSDAKQLEFYEDRGPRSFKTDIQSVKNRNLADPEAAEPVIEDRVALSKTIEKPSKSPASQPPLEDLHTNVSWQSNSVLVENKTRNGFLRVITSSYKEGGSNTADNANDGSADTTLKPLGECVASTVPGVKASITLSNIGNNRPIVSLEDSARKTELESDSKELSTVLVSSLADVNVTHTSPIIAPVIANHPGPVPGRENIFKNKKGNDVGDGSPLSAEEKLGDIQQNAEDINPHENKDKELPNGGHREVRQEVRVCEAQKSPLVPKHVMGVDELCKSGGNLSAAAAAPPPPDQLKVKVSVGKASTLSSVMISKSPGCSNSKPLDTENAHPDGKKQIVVDRNAGAKDENASSDVIDESKRDVTRKPSKDHSTSSSVRVSNSSKNLHPSASNKSASISKDCAVPSSKSSAAQNMVDAADPACTLSNQRSSHAENKLSGSQVSQKVGKSNQTNSHPSSKGNQTATVHQSAVSNSPAAALSDEELALLLHQELNSSPRVPRVPRMRQAGALPQLASQAAVTMLIKRSSSSAAKDHNIVPKRKGKESSKESLHQPRNLDDEVKKYSRSASLLDHRRQDTPLSGDTSVREANGSPLHVYTFKRKSSGLSTSANSGPSSSTEVTDNKLSSMLGSPVSNSDDDFAAASTTACRTLPGLINEIMSKGKKMTYEELCDAVLPHWNSLRKLNGERYAYASHSQAVLDCLRNRHEWSQLVDRGPKTNSSKKKRKADSEELLEEEDDEDEESSLKQPLQSTREVERRNLESRQEDFPKGKRKARSRRRRLTLQGRGVKDLRKRRKSELLTDEDDEAAAAAAAFSNNSSEEEEEEAEDSIFSEEETTTTTTTTSQVGLVRVVPPEGGGSEGSSSSDELSH